MKRVTEEEITEPGRRPVSDLVDGCTARPCVVCEQPAHDTGQDCRTLARQSRHEALAEAKARGWRDYEPDPDPRDGCPIRAHHLGMTCGRCRDRMRRQLLEIPELYALAGGELSPGASAGGGGTEASLGLRVAALDFREGSDVLGMLASWARTWEEDFDDTPRDWSRLSHGTDRVGATLVDLTRHLSRELDRACAVTPGIDVFAQELNDLHLEARVAARTITARHTEVECPADREDGICRARIRVGGLELKDVVHCPKCHTRWELKRLLLVADSDREAGAWLPVDDVALLIGVPKRTLNRWASEGRVQRAHGLFELQSVRDAIAAGTGKSKGASA